jgi:hypothetical protein
MQQLIRRLSSVTFGVHRMVKMLWRGVRKMKKASSQAAIVKATIQAAMKISEYNCNSVFQNCLHNEICIAWPVIFTV